MRRWRVLTCSTIFVRETGPWQFLWSFLEFFDFSVLHLPVTLWISDTHHLVNMLAFSQQITQLAPKRGLVLRQKHHPKCLPTLASLPQRTLMTPSSRTHAIPRIPPARTAIRSFTSSRPARADDSTVKDPEHPSGIYYHTLADGRYGMSFLEKPPSSPSAASIIAHVTRPSNVADRNEPIYHIAVDYPDQVLQHDKFMDLLHDTLKSEAIPNDGMLEYEAVLRQTGWAHVNDQRHQLMPGRIPTPENILASVAISDGQLAMQSYERNDTYRVSTAEEGVMQLRPEWLARVKRRCEEVN